MRNYVIFLKKEFIEAFKTYKLLVMGAAFLILGLMGPLTAKFTPEIIKWAMETDPSMAGMDLGALLSEPVAWDSWVQFYGNVGLMGFVALIIVFSGMLSSEISKGTLTIILTKGLSRTTVILAKLTSSVVIWTGSFLLAFLTSWGYTIYLFPDGKIHNLAFAMFCMWFYGVFLLAVTAFAATVTKRNYVCMIIVGALAVVLNIMNLIPYVVLYNPDTLTSGGVSLLSNDAAVSRFYPSLAITGIAIIALTSAAIISFNKKKNVKAVSIVAGFVAVGMAVTIFFGEEAPAKIKLSQHVITEKIIIGEGGEWELHGVLTLPKNASKDNKVPAVVLVHGSGVHDMDETIFGNKPFRDIAEYLSTNGIAVIRYNMRQLTHMNKMPHDAMLWDEKIEDAILATEMLKADERIDESKVYILGHSLGGLLAPRINEEGGDYAGIIMFAGSSRPLIDIVKQQNYDVIYAMDDGDEKEAMLLEMEMWDEFYGEFINLPDDVAKITEIPGWGITAYYFKDAFVTSAEEYIERIHIPFLVLQPEDDVQVLAEIDYVEFQKILAGRDNVTFKLYPGLNHLFLPSRGYDITEIMDEYKYRGKVDEQVLQDIVDWVKASK
ncbi:MAG: ABC transporter permease subunit [Oscillospiraceae bacterium]|nr:ABC transporter permease subunit [Oscillospiraceae bacterium]